MCDYSLTNVKSRPAKVGDKLVIHDFGTGTRGFRDIADRDITGCTAVCLLPGTELAFDWVAICAVNGRQHNVRTAIFRQINRESKSTHHDAIQLPDGELILLNMLVKNQTATVLQLPKVPTTEKEMDEQRRLEYVG